jgi:hypothetical protein
LPLPIRKTAAQLRHNTTEDSSFHPSDINKLKLLQHGGHFGALEGSLDNFAKFYDLSLLVRNIVICEIAILSSIDFEAIPY